MTRVSTPRHYLMVRPSHFDVSYSINPWMHPDRPTSSDLAVTQWERLRELFVDLGHTVELLNPVQGLPDMVFAANGATVIDGRALVARFRHEQRDPESASYIEWFKNAGYAEVRQAAYINEGEGDYLVTGSHILAGSGFRTDPRAHAEAEEFFGRPVIGLTLVDPRFYHLDTALAPLDEETVMYYPAAFAPESLHLLEKMYPDAVKADDHDAEVFGLNAVSDGAHVILPQAATGLMAQVAERGFEPIGMDLSELLKAGGSVKCCTLELRGE